MNIYLKGQVKEKASVLTGTIAVVGALAEPTIAAIRENNKAKNDHADAVLRDKAEFDMQKLHNVFYARNLRTCSSAAIKLVSICLIAFVIIKTVPHIMGPRSDAEDDRKMSAMFDEMEKKIEEEAEARKREESERLDLKIRVSIFIVVSIIILIIAAAVSWVRRSNGKENVKDDDNKYQKTTRKATRNQQKNTRR